MCIRDSINGLLELEHPIEIVNEANTSEHVENPDIHAAISIALTRGYRVSNRFEIVPTEGELKNIQRLSRLESEGKITISKELARRVALGELSLRTAIIEQTEND